MHGQTTVHHPIAIPNACVDISSHNSIDNNNNNGRVQVLNNTPIPTPYSINTFMPLQSSQYTLNIIGNNKLKDNRYENESDRIANQQDIQRNLDDILLKMSSLQKQRQQQQEQEQEQQQQQFNLFNKDTIANTNLNISNISSNYSRQNDINMKNSIDDIDIDSTETHEDDKNLLYYDNDTEQTMTLTLELFAHKLDFFNTAIYNIQQKAEEFEEIKQFIKQKESSYKIELQRLQEREKQSLESVHDMYNRQRGTIQEVLQQKKELARDHILREMHQIKKRLRKYKRMPQKFSLIGCKSNTDQNNSRSIKIRIRRQKPISRDQIQSEVKETFLNWKDTLLENKRVTRTMALRLNYNKPNSDLQKYSFSLSYDELKEDLNLMIEQYRRECKKQAQTLKKKVRKSSSPLANSSKQIVHGWTNKTKSSSTSTSTSTKIAKDSKNKKRSDSSTDDSSTYKSHSNGNESSPVEFLNDPSDTNYSLRKSKRIRKPVVSYCERSVSMDPCEPQKVTRLGPMTVILNGYKIEIGDRVKINFLEDDKCMFGTLCEIQKNQIFLTTSKHKRLKIQFKDLESGIINVHPSGP